MIRLTMRATLASPDFMTSKPSPGFELLVAGSSSIARYLASLALSVPTWYSVALLYCVLASSAACGPDARRDAIRQRSQRAASGRGPRARSHPERLPSGERAHSVSLRERQEARVATRLLEDTHGGVRAAVAVVRRWSGRVREASEELVELREDRGRSRRELASGGNELGPKAAAARARAGGELVCTSTFIMSAFLQPLKQVKYILFGTAAARQLGVHRALLAVWRGQEGDGLAV